MKRWIILCAVLALVQTGLTVATHLGSRSDETKVAKGPLLALQSARINELLLEDNEGHQLPIKKSNDQWLLPACDNFPADSTRVQGLLDKLTDLQRAWPEAATADAATRFKVAANSFAHKLTLLQDGKPAATIYFGTSPGLRKLYLRADKEAEIHSLAITPQDLDTKAEHWIDTAILHLKADQIVRVRLPEVTLERTKEGLQPVGLQENEELLKERVDALVDRVTRLSIANILGKEAKPEYSLDAPVMQYSVELDGGTTITYSFGKHSQPAKAVEKDQDAEKDAPPPVRGDNFVLKVSTQEQLLEVDGWQVDELKKADRASMIKVKTQEQTTGNKVNTIPLSAPASSTTAE